MHETLDLGEWFETTESLEIREGESDFWLVVWIGELGRVARM